MGAVNAAALASAPTVAGVNRLASSWHELAQREIYPADPRQALTAIARSLPALPLGVLRAIGMRNAAYPFRPLAALAGVAGLADSLVPGRARERLINRLCSLTQLDLAAVPLEIERVGPTTLVDASIAESTAVDRAVASGADEVYVLPSGFACDLDDPPPTAYGVAVHASTVLIEQRLLASMARADPRVAIYAVPPLCPLSVLPVDFAHSVELILRAEEATRRWLRGGHRAVPGLSRALGAHGGSGILDLTAVGLGASPS
jgi:NTE family protein